MCHLVHLTGDGCLQDWQVPLGRRFRALKVWFVLRTYGRQGLQSYIEHHLRLAGLFQGLVEADERFEITAPPRFGLVCFALKVGPLNRKPNGKQASDLVGQVSCFLPDMVLAQIPECT